MPYNLVVLFFVLVLQQHCTSTGSGPLLGVATARFWTRNPVKIISCFILPAVLYGRETLSLTLTEQQRLRAFKKREVRKTFGLKRKEMTGDYRRLQNE